MFDKWFLQDIEKILSKRNQVVVIVDSAHIDLLKKLLSDKYKILIVNNASEELECKYNIEKYHKDIKVVIMTSMPKESLTFILDYIETCGFVKIYNLDAYIKEKVYLELKMNVNLTVEEFKASAYNSLGKGKEYWEEIYRKGGSGVFDIGMEILPFLNDPGGFCASRNNVVIKPFFEKINIWLDRPETNQPPKILAQEVATKILSATLVNQFDKKYLDIYNKWVDSKEYENALKNYCKLVELPKGDLWGIQPVHPFDEADLCWVKDIANHLTDTAYIKSKLPLLSARAKTAKGKEWRKGIWLNILQLLEFDASKIKEITSFDSALRFYTDKLYQVDTAIRVIYEEFWGDNETVKMFQEFYNNLMSPFLSKWFKDFGKYQENQKGILLDKIQSAKGKIAIVVGDGITYEIIQCVNKKLDKNINIDNQFRCCGLPSVTENNMSLLYKDDGIVEAVHRKREEYLAKQIKQKIQFEQLDEINYESANADVLICSYKDIDDMGEKLQQKALKFIGEFENNLVEKIDFLLHNGFQEVVVTSDHGFVLTGILTESDKVEVQFTGEVSKSERFIRTVERQKISSDYIEIKQPYGNFQYLYFAKNMKPFKTPGKYGYAHGGLSPQELIIPFVTYSSKALKAQELKVEITNHSQLKAIVGSNFSIHLKATNEDGTLFGSERKIQLLFIDKGKEFYKSDIVTIKAGEPIKKEYNFEGHRNIEVFVIDASTKQNLTKAVVSQVIARDLGGLN